MSVDATLESELQCQHSLYGVQTVPLHGGISEHIVIVTFSGGWDRAVSIVTGYGLDD
jgi:hypothetical protein